MRYFSASALVLVLNLAPGTAADDEKKESTAEVSGKVTLADDKPLPAGLLNFTDPSGRHTVQVMVNKGNYKAANVPVGEKIKVTVDVKAFEARAAQLKLELAGMEERQRLQKEAKAEDDKLAAQIKKARERLKHYEELVKRVRGVKVPDKEITVAVKPGKQTIDLKLAD